MWRLTQPALTPQNPAVPPGLPSNGIDHVVAATCHYHQPQQHHQQPQQPHTPEDQPDTFVLAVTTSGWMFSGSMAGLPYPQAWQLQAAHGGSTAPLLPGSLRFSPEHGGFELLLVQPGGWQLLRSCSLHPTSSFPTGWSLVGGALPPGQPQPSLFAPFTEAWRKQQQEKQKQQETQHGVMGAIQELSFAYAAKQQLGQQLPHSRLQSSSANEPSFNFTSQQQRSSPQQQQQTLQQVGERKPSIPIPWQQPRAVRFGGVSDLRTPPRGGRSSNALNEEEGEDDNSSRSSSSSRIDDSGSSVAVLPRDGALGAEEEGGENGEGESEVSSSVLMRRLRGRRPEREQRPRLAGGALLIGAAAAVRSGRGGSSDGSGAPHCNSSSGRGAPLCVVWDAVGGCSLFDPCGGSGNACSTTACNQPLLLCSWQLAQPPQSPHAVGGAAGAQQLTVFAQALDKGRFVAAAMQPLSSSSTSSSSSSNSCYMEGSFASCSSSWQEGAGKLQRCEARLLAMMGGGRLARGCWSTPWALPDHWQPHDSSSCSSTCAISGAACAPHGVEAPMHAAGASMQAHAHAYAGCKRRLEEEFGPGATSAAAAAPVREQRSDPVIAAAPLGPDEDCEVQVDAVDAASGADAASDADSLASSFAHAAPRAPAQKKLKQPRLDLQQLLQGGVRAQASCAEAQSAVAATRRLAAPCGVAPPRERRAPITHALLVGSDQPGLLQVAMCDAGGRLSFHGLAEYCTPQVLDACHILGAAHGTTACGMSDMGHTGRVTFTMEVHFKCPPMDLVVPALHARRRQRQQQQVQHAWGLATAASSGALSADVCEPSGAAAAAGGGAGWLSQQTTPVGSRRTSYSDFGQAPSAPLPLGASSAADAAPDAAAQRQAPFYAAGAGDAQHAYPGWISRPSSAAGSEFGSSMAHAAAGCSGGAQEAAAPGYLGMEGVRGRPLLGGLVPLLLTGGEDGGVVAWDLRVAHLGERWMAVHPHAGAWFGCFAMGLFDVVMIWACWS